MRLVEVAVSPDARVAALTVPTDGFRSGRRVIVLDVATARIVRTIDLGDYREPHAIEFLSDSVALVGTLGGTSAVFVDVYQGGAATSRYRKLARSLKSTWAREGSSVGSRHSQGWTASPTLRAERGECIRGLISSL